MLVGAAQRLVRSRSVTSIDTLIVNAVIPPAVVTASMMVTAQARVSVIIPVTALGIDKLDFD